MQTSDLELVKLARKGDAVAFEKLVDKYERKVMALALRFTGDVDEAKDIFQEVFIRTYKGLKNFEERSQFSTWLYRIATNVSLTYVTKKGKNKTISISNNFDEDDDKNFGIENEITSTDKTNQLLEDSEIRNRVNTALINLSPQEKIVFTLRHYEEFKLKEIAKIMKCAEGTVKKYLFTATRKMRVQLADLA